MTIPQIRMVSVRSIVSPVSAENKEIVFFRKITEIKLQRCRNLLKPGKFYRLSQTDDTNPRINLFYRIGIGGDNIRIEDLRHLDDYFLAPANGSEIIMEDGNSHGSFPGP